MVPDLVSSLMASLVQLPAFTAGTIAAGTENHITHMTEHHLGFVDRALELGRTFVIFDVRDEVCSVAG